MTGFFSGLMVLSDTARIIRSRFGLLLMLLIAILILGVQGGGLWLLWDLTAGTSAVMLWGLRIVGVLMLLLGAPILVWLLLQIIFPLFAEKIFWLSVAELRPGLVVLKQQKGIGTIVGLKRTFKRLFYMLVVVISGLVLAMIPGVGVVGAVICWFIFGLLFVEELLDPYVDHAKSDSMGQKKLRKDMRYEIWGFALSSGILVMIPVVGPLLFLPAQWSVVRILPKKSS